MVECNTDETAQVQRTYRQVLAAERMGRVIPAPSDPTREEIGKLLDHHTPLVAFGRMVDDQRADMEGRHGRI